MGRTRLWLIVEGRVHDRPFYDRLLSSILTGDKQSFSIRLAEEIDLESTSAGGKDFALELHDFFLTNDLLKQENSEGERQIVFGLDRDLDHLGSIADIARSHVMRTESMDVEAEILLNGNVVDAAAAAFSLTREMVGPVLRPARALASELADHWGEWVVLGGCAMGLGVHTEVSHSHRSQIHRGGFGERMGDKADEFAEKMRSRLEEIAGQDSFNAFEEMIEEFYQRGEQWDLVKGKWLASFVWYKVTREFSGQPIERNVTTDTITKTCLGTLRWDGDWTLPYRRRLEAILAG